MAKTLPKTGEARKTRQPLNIDRLPPETRELIIWWKNDQGKTWLEVEDLSRTFVKWDMLDPLVVKLFPGKYLPRTNLHRWYDLRVEQVRRDVMARSERARELAEAFAKAGTSGDLNESVVNAARDTIFALMESADEKSRVKLQSGLLKLGLLLAEFEKNKIKQQTVDLETKRIAMLKEEADRKKKQFEKLTNEATAKIKKGGAEAVAAVDNIVATVFGSSPAKRTAGPGVSA